MKTRLIDVLISFFSLFISSCVNSLPDYYTIRDCPKNTGQQNVFKLYGDPVGIFRSKRDILDALPLEFLPKEWLQPGDDTETTLSEFFEPMLKKKTGGYRYWLYETRAGERIIALIMVFNELEQFIHYIELKPWKKGLIKDYVLK